MSPVEFGEYIRLHHTTLEGELAKVGVSYASLAPALVPSTKRNEMALFFNSDMVEGGLYGYRLAKKVIPLLDANSTLAYLSGDIAIPPEDTRAFADLAGLVPTSNKSWGDQFTYCIYLNNLSSDQVRRIHIGLEELPEYLGHVVAAYGSPFKTILGTMLPTTFVKTRGTVLVDHGLDDPFVSNVNEVGFPFAASGLRVVSVMSSMYSPLLTYKIESLAQPQYTDDILISLNAISEEPMLLGDFEVVLSSGKFGYVQTQKRELLELAGVENLAADDLAAMIRTEIQNSSIYRLQFNPDSTVQFSVVIEVAREDDHPIRLAVGLKYLPASRSLFIVTIT